MAHLKSNSFVKEPLPYGYILYRADDFETKRKLELHSTAVKPQVTLRLEQNQK